MFSPLVHALGNCKDCNKRRTESGKSKVSIQEIIIHDNPPGTIESFRLFRSFCSRFYSCFGGSGGFVSVFPWLRWFRFGVSVVSVASFRCFGGSGGCGGFVSVFRVLVNAHLLHYDM